LAATRFREANLCAAASGPRACGDRNWRTIWWAAGSFREAHEIVGKVLRAAEQDRKSIREMPLARLKEFSPVFGATWRRC